MHSEEQDAPIKSVRKAIEILEYLSEARRPLRVTEIARGLHMSVSAVSRLVATMTQRGMITQDAESGRCYLGLGLTVLGANALGRRSLDRIAMPVMEDLAKRISGYVSLGRLSKGKAVLMRALPPPLSQHGVNIIVVMPFHACAPGKVLSSGLMPSDIRGMLAEFGMDPITSHTIANADAFLEEVELTRRRGFAIDDQESSYDVRHLACPILDHQGKVAASLSAGGALLNFPDREMPALLQALSHACLRISREMGYTGRALVDVSSELGEAR